MILFFIGLLIGVCITFFTYLISKRYTKGNKILHTLERLASPKASIILLKDPVDELSDILEKERQNV